MYKEISMLVEMCVTIARMSGRDIDDINDIYTWTPGDGGQLNVWFHSKNCDVLGSILAVLPKAEVREAA